MPVSFPYVHFLAVSLSYIATTPTEQNRLKQKLTTPNAQGYLRPYTSAI